MNLIDVDGYHPKLNFDEETISFAEILGLSGGADFYDPQARMKTS